MAPKRKADTKIDSKAKKPATDEKQEAAKTEGDHKVDTNNITSAKGDATDDKAATTSSKPDSVKPRKSGKIEIGDSIPSIILKDHASEDVTLADVAKEHGIVLFSYPAASTPGCTSQGCSYRDHYEEITKKGYKVYGISTDTVNAQQKFKTKQNFQYPLLSDQKKELLGVLGGTSSAKKTARRCHWVIKKGGILASAEIDVKPKDCVAKALKTIDSIEKET